ncbi:hypothetical protein OC844_002092 [Tilletia horrida]|nr:hypothetical protein OC844_002092 [Tilletia horrida]
MNFALILSLALALAASVASASFSSPGGPSLADPKHLSLGEAARHVIKYIAPPDLIADLSWLSVPAAAARAEPPVPAEPVPDLLYDIWATHYRQWEATMTDINERIGRLEHLQPEGRQQVEALLAQARQTSDRAKAVLAEMTRAGGPHPPP